MLLLLLLAEQHQLLMGKVVDVVNLFLCSTDGLHACRRRRGLLHNFVTRMQIELKIHKNMSPPPSPPGPKISQESCSNLFCMLSVLPGASCQSMRFCLNYVRKGLVKPSGSSSRPIRRGTRRCGSKGRDRGPPSGASSGCADLIHAAFVAPAGVRSRACLPGAEMLPTCNRDERGEVVAVPRRDIAVVIRCRSNCCVVKNYDRRRPRHAMGTTAAATRGVSSLGGSRERSGLEWATDLVAYSSRTLSPVKLSKFDF